MRRAPVTLLAAASLAIAVCAAIVWPWSWWHPGRTYLELKLTQLGIEAAEGHVEFQVCPTFEGGMGKVVVRPLPLNVRLTDPADMVWPLPWEERRSIGAGGFALERTTVIMPLERLPASGWDDFVSPVVSTRGGPWVSEWYSLRLLLWFIAAAGLLPPLLWYRYRICIPRHRRRHGLCLECGYDLRATAEVCPECGRPVPATVPLPRGRAR